MGNFSKENETPKLDLKYVDQKIGFIVHLSMAYPFISPLIKGLDNKTNYWREGRYTNVSKMSN